MKKREDVDSHFFKFIANASARYLYKNSINRGANRIFNQSGWVEIQVAHSTANTSANKETQLKSISFDNNKP